MATDFYPDRPIPFDRFLAVVRDEPRLSVVHEIASGTAAIERPRGNFVHASRMTDGNTIVSRYGNNDAEPVLLVLDELFVVRFGPEHERADRGSDGRISKPDMIATRIAWLKLEANCAEFSRYDSVPGSPVDLGMLVDWFFNYEDGVSEQRRREVVAWLEALPPGLVATPPGRKGYRIIRCDWPVDE
jgi:hypothetical protein